MKQNLNRFSFGATDGIIALGITTFTLLPGSHLHHAVGELLLSKVTVADSVFGLFFILMWRYCFSVLKLYDKFATISSRMAATLQGVLIMMLPTLAYYKIFHPNALTIRSAIITSLALFCYEINRFSFSVHLLDLLAARDPRRAIIIGSGRRASKAWRAVRTRYRSSLTLVGFMDDRSIDEMPPDVARRYLGTIDDLSQTLLKDVVDLILVAMPIQSCYPIMQRAIHIAESAGVQVVYLDDIYSTRNQNDDPNQSIFRELAPDQEHYLMFLATKRCVDIIGAVTGLILLAPLLAGLAITVKLTSKGPALFKQERYGYRRRRFSMFKFRSMVQDAEHLQSGLEHANEAVGPIFKMQDDPRVTRFGRILRKTSLDELPQLWNVLRGDMSLVGPRPMSVRDVALFDHASLMRRFSVRPGMTGLWQVSGRSGIGFDQWILMDNLYIDGWSLGLTQRF